MARSSESEFVGLLYEAALGRVDWTDVVGEMSGTFGSGSAALYASDPIHGDTSVIGLHGMSTQFTELYGTEFLNHDLWAQAQIHRGVFGKSALGNELVLDSVWERSFIYNEFLRSQTDVFHLVGAMVKLESGKVVAVGCHRSRKDRAFSPDDKARFDRLLPHVQRSVEMSERLALASGSTSLLDRTASALIQLDSNGRIRQTNAAADRILEAGDGLCRSGGNRVHALLRRDDSTLQKLLGGAALTTMGDGERGTAGGYVRVSRPSGKRPYNVLISPLGLDRTLFTASAAAVLMCVADPEQRPAIDVAALGALYGLSTAEARMALKVATGMPLKDIARNMNVSINTIRTLLARAMTKTETNSQIGLIRLVLTAPARLPRPPA